MAHIWKLILVTLLLQGIHQVNGIIGYDCGSAASNLTTISLLTIEECDIPSRQINSSRVYIQMLQVNDFKTTKVIQCKVEIDRQVKRCGMFSHTMDVANGKYAFIQEVTQEACMRMHTYGHFVIGNTFIAGLKSNITTTRPITLAGRVDNEGVCAGTAYSDEYGSWIDVIVLATVKITLQDYRATIRLNTNQIMLRSGVSCDLKKGQCTDIEGGNTFWNYIPAGECRTSDFGVLYEGYATKMVDETERNAPTIYSMVTKDTTFALASRGLTKSCGYSLIKTEHPKLFIFETTTALGVFKKVQDPTNMDIFTYMNSKFVYVEKHLRHQINQLYRNILYQQCNLEQKMLQNALAIATQSPDIFAYHLMKGPGYTSVLAGEVIHIVKCLPVEVQVTSTSSCYNHLPILWNNKTYYLTPQTHLILRQGTEITCNSLAPAMYQLGDAWYKMMPKPVEALPPTILKPMTKPEWKYTNPGSLATSGIYTQTDLEDLKDHIMFPAERPAVLNTIARGMMGHSATIHGGSITNLLDEASLEKLASSTWDKIWGRFLIFGNISAGILGIFLIIRVIKLILDTVLHGIALHSVYGCSCYLLGSLWDSLTHLLILLGGKKTAKFHEEPVESQPMVTRSDRAIVSTQPSCPTIETTHQRLHPILPPEETTKFTLSLSS